LGHAGGALPAGRRTKNDSSKEGTAELRGQFSYSPGFQKWTARNIFHWNTTKGGPPGGRQTGPGDRIRGSGWGGRGWTRLIVRAESHPRPHLFFFFGRLWVIPGETPEKTFRGGGAPPRIKGPDIVWGAKTGTLWGPTGGKLVGLTGSLRLPLGIGTDAGRLSFDVTSFRDVPRFHPRAFWAGGDSAGLDQGATLPCRPPDFPRRQTVSGGSPSPQIAPGPINVIASPFRIWFPGAGRQKGSVARRLLGAKAGLKFVHYVSNNSGAICIRSR